MDRSCLGTAAREVACGELLFASLVGDMFSWEDRLVTGPGSALDGGWGPCLWPLGRVGSPRPLPGAFPEGFGSPDAGPWAQSTRCRELGLLLPLLPPAAAAEGCLPGLVPRDVPACSAPGRPTCSCSTSWKFLVGSLVWEKARGTSSLRWAPDAHLVARWMAEPGQREEGFAL